MKNTKTILAAILAAATLTACAIPASARGGHGQHHVQAVSGLCQGLQQCHAEFGNARRRAVQAIANLNSSASDTQSAASGCVWVDEDGDGICDNYGSEFCNHHHWVDEDGDGICDNYGSGNCPHTGWVDGDGDGVCDNYDPNYCPGNGTSNGSGAGNGSGYGCHGGGHHGGRHCQ